MDRVGAVPGEQRPFLSAEPLGQRDVAGPGFVEQGWLERSGDRAAQEVGIVAMADLDERVVGPEISARFAGVDDLVREGRGLGDRKAERAGGLP